MPSFSICAANSQSSTTYRAAAARHFSSSSSSSQSSNHDENDGSLSSIADGYYRSYEKLFRQTADFAQSDADVSSISSSKPNNSSSIGDLKTNISDPLDDVDSKPYLSHVDQTGGVKMVDVGSKGETRRVAVATGRVSLGDVAFRLVVENRMKKGNVLATAQLAGIMAAKRTSGLIPLCHHVALSSVDVELSLDDESLEVRVRCTAKAIGQTGVEMEALTGVAVAALTVYDMCKSVSHDIVVGDIRLVSKTGGKSDYRGAPEV